MIIIPPPHSAVWTVSHSAGAVGKDAGAVTGDDGQIDGLAVAAQAELEAVLVEAEGHTEVIADRLFLI